jgi:hypothetical protein
MSVWGALAGGFVGTVVLTTALRAASELRLTRMDIPFLLGTALTANRLLAKTVGYVLHFAIGLGFALLYYAIFAAINLSGWWLGAILGLAHGVAVTTALVNDLPPLLHPRMGSPLTGAHTTALLEAPGFLMLNYGPQTPIVNILAHIAYGTIVGGFTHIASSL